MLQDVWVAATGNADFGYFGGGYPTDSINSKIVLITLMILLRHHQKDHYLKCSLYDTATAAAKGPLGATGNAKLWLLLVVLVLLN